jgi:hypothetical protein
MLKPIEYTYKITEDELPILNTVYHLSDNRSTYMKDDFEEGLIFYKKLNEKNSEIKIPKYWLNEIKNNIDIIDKIHDFGIDYRLKKAFLTFTTLNYINKETEVELLAKIKKITDSFFDVRKITFDLRNTWAFKCVKHNEKKLHLFEKWLFGDCIYSLENLLNTYDTNIYKIEDGIYFSNFVSNVDEVYIQKKVFNYVEQHLLEIVEEVSKYPDEEQ